MMLSRGGVVRVGDLVAALREQEPELAERLLSRRSLTVRPPLATSVEGDCVPMANEPARRELLRHSYELAHTSFGATQARITPASLIGALVSSPAQFPGSPPSVHRDTPPACPTAPNRAASPVGSPAREPADLESLVAMILDHWLAARRLSEGND